MSAGVCGKRVGFEELFAPSSPTIKRSRCSSYGSPVGSGEFGSGSDDPVSVLMHMFPALDPEVVKMVLSNNNNKIEDAKESLQTLSSGNAVERTKINNFDSAIAGACVDTRGESTTTCSQMFEQETGDVNETEINTNNEHTINGFNWADLFVSEMKNATDMNDVRRRAAIILEAFEKSITANSRAAKELECASLKEHLQSLLNDNQVLKRVVAIQHERHLEHEERNKEVQHLKRVLSQYQEQVHKLELNNYALQLHLQRAQQSNSFPGHLPPDVY